MKRILVGVDGSEGSEHALNKAISVIDEFGELFLLAVIPSQSNEIFLDSKMLNKLKVKAEVIIEEMISNIGKHSFNITVMVEEGDPSAKIIDLANKLGVDLIVLGSKGSSKLGRYLIGSVANRVVQYAHKPVMVVRI